jgi:MFS family permease
MSEAQAPPASGPSQLLIALIAGQIGLHACMTGVRMAAPLQALRQGQEAWVVGLLMGLFALAPIVLALHLAVLLSIAGALLAALATLLPPPWTVAALLAMCGAALLVGAGANIGLIAIQRTAGRSAGDAAQMRRIFSWLGLAPALANVVGPVLAGALIDLGGFALAYAVLTLLPLVAWWWSRRVPREVPPPRPPGPRPSTWDLLRTPGLRRLLLINWLLSSSWDVHAFLVPVLGHERGFSASAIGLVLGLFAAAVAAVRLLIPLLAHRLREGQVLAGAMLATAVLFAFYPLVHAAWLMALFATLLGFALGSVQPMIMTTLHQITPHERHGEAIALRSMTINFASALMPLLFGALGATLGASMLFWLMGAAVGAGSVPARRVGASIRT